MRKVLKKKIINKILPSSKIKIIINSLNYELNEKPQIEGSIIQLNCIPDILRSKKNKNIMNLLITIKEILNLLFLKIFLEF